MNSEIHLSNVVVYFMREARDGSAPSGTPALFSRRDGRIIEAPTQFLRDRFVRSGKARAQATWRSAAYAIASWWDFLESRQIEWNIASKEDLIAYRDFYLSHASPKTGDVYSANTVAYRMCIVGSFYHYTWSTGDYSGSILQVLLASESYPRKVEVAFGSGNVRRASTSVGLDARLIPRANSVTKIRPYSRDDWAALTATLGPLPSECNGSTGCRDRLIITLALTMGLRVGEVAALTVYQFARITEGESFSNHFIEVFGKGSKKRMAACPGWLVAEVNLYVSGQRHASIRAGKIREHGKLLVAGEAAARPGTPLSIRRLEEIHANACLRAGLTKGLDESAVSRKSVVPPRYRFHDLRHTYAVWTYSVLKMQGDPEPWKAIQAQLGHRSLETTINTYLRTVTLIDDKLPVLDLRSAMGW